MGTLAKNTNFSDFLNGFNLTKYNKEKIQRKKKTMWVKDILNVLVAIYVDRLLLLNTKF